MRSPAMSRPASAQDAVAVGNRWVTPSMPVASRKTEAPVSSLTAAIARATMSRGASSARSSKLSMNLRPSKSTRVAPSPLRASVRSRAGRPGTSRAVGWNCTNSRSARAAPESHARAMPSPRARSGPVRRPKIPVAPPLARTTRSASSSEPRWVLTPTARPSSVNSAAARASIRSILSLEATDASSVRRIARPVASPPEWSTRRALWPPSSVGAPPASKAIPRAINSEMALGASAVRMPTASASHKPAPETSVSAAWAAGSSPTPTAAAMPPWASDVELEEGSGATIQTGPRSAACSAHHRPAAPAPTTRVLTGVRLAPALSRSSVGPRVLP